MSLSPALYVVDDAPQSRDAVCELARSMGIRCLAFSSAAELLEFCEDLHGCVLIDEQMPGMSGLELQEELLQQGYDVPVVLMTAIPQTPLTVQAMHNGAVAVLDKPCDAELLWQAVQSAFALHAERRCRQGRCAEVQDRLNGMTDQEREVLQMIVEGSPNKAIARRLDVSLRTVENRRRSVFAKMGVRSVAELVTAVIQTVPEQSRPHWDESSARSSERRARRAQFN